MRTARILLVILLSVMLAIALVPAAAADGAHTVSGVVRGAAGEPIAAAAIDAYQAFGGDYVGSAVTGPDGSYRVPGLADGTYELRATADGYVPQSYTSNPLLLASGSEGAGVDFVLELGLTISGAVQGTDDAPVPWARVIAYRENGKQVARTSTDELGRFELQGLPSGVFRIRAEDRSGSYLDGWYDAKAAFKTADAVEAGTSNVLVRLRVAGTGSISGRFTGDVSPGVAHWAEAVAVDGTFAREVRVMSGDAEAMFEIDRLPAGDYKVRAWSQTADVSYYGDSGLWAAPGRGRSIPEEGAVTVHVEEGAATPGADIQLSNGSATIFGLVSDGAGLPLSGQEVRLLTLDGSLIGGFTATSGQDGRFELSGLPEGKYFAQVLDATGQLRDMYFGRGGGSPRLNDAIVINLTPGRAYRGCEVTLPPRQGGLSGTVDGPAGNPVAGVHVTVYDGQGSVIATSVTGANGAYVFGTLANGAYRVLARDPSGRFASSWVDGQVSVVQGQGARGDVSLAVARVPVSVRIAASRSTLARGQLVTLTGWMVPRRVGARVRLTQVDSAGRRVVRTLVTDASGRARATSRLFRSASFRLAFYGDAQTRPGASRVVAVRVVAAR